MLNPNKQQLTSFDFETYGLDVYNRRIKIFSYCIGYIENGKIKVIVKKYKGEGKKFLHDYLMNPNYVKIAHNYKYELSILKTNNIPFHKDTLWHDTMIESQMLFNTRHSHALDSIAYDFFGFTRKLDKKFKEFMKAGYTVDKIPADFLYKYQVADGIRPLLIHYLLFPDIYKDRRLRECYYNEIENIKMTQQEEQFGIKLHQENCTAMKKVLTKGLAGLKKYYREDLNLNSSKQLRKLFYEELKIKPINFTAKGEPSTDKNTIMQLTKESKNPMLLGIIKNRSYSAALSNIEKWETLQDRFGIIHPNINTNWARTGRRSCTNPNLYNINSKGALLNLFPVPLRRCFEPRAGFVLAPVDQAQIELRLIIDSAGEKEVIAYLLEDPDRDLHHLTVECFSMKKIFNFIGDDIFNEGIKIAKDLKINNPKLYSTMRSAYKNTGFAIGYGAGLEKLAQILNKKPKEIYIGYNNFVKRLPKIASFTRDTTAHIEEYGGIETAFGRFLHVDPAKAYSGANYLIQGTAAEIHKRGQVRCFKFFEKNKLSKWMHINLDIYDENVFETHKSLLKSSEFPAIKNHLSKLMENLDQIKIPLKCEWQIAENNWNEKKDLVI